MSLDGGHDRSGGRAEQALDAVSLVDDVLAKATALGASDVHFEPTESGLQIKFRLDGALQTVETLPRAIAENVVTRLKVLGGLLTYRNDVPQEGRIESPRAGRDVVIDRRLAVFPTIYGQRAVVRLLYRQDELGDLSRLGFGEQISASLCEIAGRNQGMLLLTGPAGSGKSTTLAALLRYVLAAFPGKSVVTLEDPVEIRIGGATQVQITPHGPMDFPTALRSLLRQDPQVLMIGEIRDAETARIAVEAGLTGHLLMSTMHSGTPAGALLRLLEMGIEPYQVTSSVSAVLNQRLVRRLCAKCKRQDSDPALRANEDRGAGFQPVGCEHCLGTGFKGRVLIAEMVQLDGPLRRAILAKADMDELQAVVAERGHSSLIEDGKRLAADGTTTKQELTMMCGIG